MRDQYIKSFYQKIAKNYGLSAQSTMQDPTVRRQEVQFVLSEIEDFILTHEVYPKVLDVGMGNGVLLHCLRMQYPNLPLWGLEFTPELYELALSRNLTQTVLLNGDMRQINDFPDEHFHIIITERSLINLGSWQEQQQAIENISSKLSYPGRYVMMESFLEPWQHLNGARHELGLDPLPISPQNTYLRESSIGLLKRRGFFERQTSMGKNALGKHFFLTRVFHPTIRPHGTRGKYLRMIEFLEKSLPDDPSGSFSPILLRSFEKQL